MASSKHAFQSTFPRLEHRIKNCLHTWLKGISVVVLHQHCQEAALIKGSSVGWPICMNGIWARCCIAAVQLCCCFGCLAEMHSCIAPRQLTCWRSTCVG